MKCKCWSPPKGFDFCCHALRVRLGLRAFGPSPNVFMLALAFPPEWMPDVLFFFLQSWGPEAWWLGEPSCCSRNHQQCTRKLAPFNESHNCFKVKLHPFKPVLHITQRGTEKSVYLQFIAEWKPQRQKWDMCKLLWIHSILSDESSMYKMERGWGWGGGIISARHICMIPDFEMEKSKESFLEQNVNFLAVSLWPGMVCNHHFSCWFRPSKELCSITISQVITGKSGDMLCE